MGNLDIEGRVLFEIDPKEIRLRVYISGGLL
jgi:hypothetical protein